LSLRADNADQRLTPLALSLGCIGDERKAAFLEKMERLEKARDLLMGSSFTPKELENAGISVSQDGKRRTGMAILAFPDVSVDRLTALQPDLGNLDEETRLQVERDAIYANYIVRQEQDIESLRRDEAQVIPTGFRFDLVDGLSNELRQKLTIVRPANIAQANRVDGMTPTALALIVSRIRQGKRVVGG
jgi:tRNA uridine 5-carboxymethylaminomethyl modification enzyme